MWIFTGVFLCFCLVGLYPSPGLILAVTLMFAILIITQAMVILKDKEAH